MFDAGDEEFDRVFGCDWSHVDLNDGVGEKVDILLMASLSIARDRRLVVAEGRMVGWRHSFMVLSRGSGQCSYDNTGASRLLFS
jgi:hypothetical protein